MQETFCRSHSSAPSVCLGLGPLARLLFTALLLAFAPVDGSAQSMHVRIPSSVTAAQLREALAEGGAEMPPEIRRQIRAKLAELEGESSAEGEEKEEGDEKETGPQQPPEVKAVLDALGSLPQPGRPATLYRAHAQLLRADATNAPAARLAWAVAERNWSGVGEVLRGLPPEVLPRAYTRLLESLARIAGSQGPAASAPDDEEEEEGAPSSVALLAVMATPGATLTPQDVEGILALAPAPLDVTNIMHVAVIAGDAYRGPNAEATLRSRLEAGLPGMPPGEAGRRLKSHLLSALGLYDPAAMAAAAASDAQAEDLLLAARHACLASNGASPVLDAGVATLLRALDMAPPVPLTELWPVVDPLLDALGTNGVSLAEAVFAKRPDLGDVLLTGRMPSGQSGKEEGNGDAEAQEGNDDDEDETETSNNPMERIRVLGRQQVLAQALCRTADPIRRTLVAGPVAVWLAEVAFSQPKLIEQMFQNNDRRYYGGSSERKPLDRDQLLATAPSREVLDVLAEPLRRRVRLARFSVELLEYAEEQRATLRELAADYQDAAPGLADTLLAGWVRSKAPPSVDEDEYERMRYYARMRGGSRLRPQPSRAGFPLTRGRQLRNLSELRTLVAELRTIAGERLDAKGVVAAFASAHSLAEVYTIEDIEAVFGRPGGIPRSVLGDLVETMRANLNQGWRDLERQTAASTGRTPDEVAIEVRRGYGIATALADEATARADAEWRDWVVRGRVYFDMAEFAYDQRAPLEECTPLRSAAFDSLRKAAASYAAAPSAPEGMTGVRTEASPYLTWLLMVLGASDSRLLMPDEARDEPGLAEVAKAIGALPPAKSASERVRLAADVQNIAERTPGHARFRLFEGAATVLGPEAPETAEIVRVLEDYRGILRECELRLQLDGSSVVGHTVPFSAHLLLFHTRQLGRESQVFSGLLDPDSERRKTIESDVRAALDPSFEITSFLFHEPDVRPYTLPRADWQATPLLHMVLRARGPAVDRVPPVAVQLDFKDHVDTVVLPIASQVEPIDAATEPAPLRPCRNLDMQTTLDTREWDTHRAVLDVSVRAEGLVPAWEQLYGTNGFPGLVVETQDSGPVVTRVSATLSGPVVHCERTWQVVCRPTPDAKADIRLALPRPMPEFAVTNVVHKQFVATDLATLSPAQVAAGIVLPLSVVAKGMGRPQWEMIVGLAAVAAILGAAAVSRRRRRGVAEAIPVPPDATPFSVLAYLGRVAREQAATLPAARLAEIEADRRQIETAFFGPDAANNAKPDLEAMLRRWA